MDKPIAFIDLETTSVNINEAKIVQFACVVLGDGVREQYSETFNPGIPIPKEASDVHGITDEKVKDRIPFHVEAQRIRDLLAGKDIGGYNCIGFDIPILYNEFQNARIEWDWRASRFFDAATIFKRQQQRRLEDAVEFYLGRKHDGAHDALTDAVAAKEVFEKQLASEILQGKTPDEISLYSNYDRKILDLGGKFALDAEGVAVFTFGKNVGKPIAKDIGYLGWMLSSDFHPDTKAFIRAYLK